MSALLLALKQQKKALRSVVSERVRSVPEASVLEQSTAVAQNLRDLDTFMSCRIVSIYLSMKGEVHTWPIVEQLFEDDKTVSIPQVGVARRRVESHAVGAFSFTCCMRPLVLSLALPHDAARRCSDRSPSRCECFRWRRSTRRALCPSTIGASRPRRTSGRRAARTSPRRVRWTSSSCRASPSTAPASGSGTGAATMVRRRLRHARRALRRGLFCFECVCGGGMRTWNGRW